MHFPHVVNVSRRDILRGAAASLLVGCGRERQSSHAIGTALADTTHVDVDVQLRASPGTVAFDGIHGSSAVLRFDARRLAGPQRTLTAHPVGSLGPTIRVARGQRLRVRFDNDLAEPSIVHWHGLDVSENNDGHPRFAVEPGESYVYTFDVDQRPGTYWYHPHPDQRTGAQVYLGLAGLFIVEDPDDEARGLPTGEHDLSIVLQDRIVARDGALIYEPNPMTGFLGDRMLINGNTNTTINVDRGCYRLRILNGSNARIYRVAWSDDAPVTVIGTDGGLLSTAIDKPYVMIAPGERLELWVDFGRVTTDEVWLETRAFDLGGASGMMRGGMGRRSTAGVPNGAGFRLCRFAISGTGPRLKRPTAFEPMQRIPDREISNLHQPRRFAISMRMMSWQVNGRRFDMTDVAANEHVKLGSSEEWEFANVSGMMSMPHPMHVHGSQFQVVARTGGDADGDLVRRGIVDEGWKDTVLVLPGETVRIRKRFATHAGLFLYHCHNLEHEDSGMMRNFRIEP